eukprot:m.355706 g.355706  ORF g.355706 m.355706 type:complete len:119 (+) comp17310_c0_seq1:213-569(+)
MWHALTYPVKMIFCFSCSHKHTAMDISRASTEEKESLCRKYFIGGFFLLPWLWIINAIWFMPYTSESRKIKNMVIGSTIGALIFMAGIIAWAVIFQLNFSSWGSIGDKLAVVIAKGAP